MAKSYYRRHSPAPSRPHFSSHQTWTSVDSSSLVHTSSPPFPFHRECRAGFSVFPIRPVSQGALLCTSQRAQPGSFCWKCPGQVDRDLRGGRRKGKARLQAVL